MNAANLALRFLLELTALYAFGRLGWGSGEGFARAVFAVAWPLVGAAVWGVFAVPGDPSRSGGAPVPIAGWLRLALEAAFFGAAALALSRVTVPRVGLWFAALVVGHYAVSVARIRWLLKAA